MTRTHTLLPLSLLAVVAVDATAPTRAPSSRFPEPPKSRRPRPLHARPHRAGRDAREHGGLPPLPHADGLRPGARRSRPRPLARPLGPPEGAPVRRDPGQGDQAVIGPTFTTSAFPSAWSTPPTSRPTRRRSRSLDRRGVRRDLPLGPHKGSGRVLLPPMRGRTSPTRRRRTFRRSRLPPEPSPTGEHVPAQRSPTPSSRISPRRRRRAPRRGAHRGSVMESHGRHEDAMNDVMNTDSKKLVSRELTEVPEVDLYGPVHKGIRWGLSRMLTRLGAADAASIPSSRGSSTTSRAPLSLRAPRAPRGSVLHPALEERRPGASRDLDRDHHAQDGHIARSARSRSGSPEPRRTGVPQSCAPSISASEPSWGEPGAHGSRGDGGASRVQPALLARRAPRHPGEAARSIGPRSASPSIG